MKIEKLTSEQLNAAAGILKAIAHPVRISILNLLDKNEKLTVTELHTMLEIEQSTTSHHLGILKDKGVLLSKRVGKNTFYYLKHNSLAHVVDCVNKCTV